MWIAFKNLYLCCLKQLIAALILAETGCELLSKICIFVVWNNIPLWVLSSSSVVNCFQKFVSLLSETTYCCINTCGNGLWIAFKNLYLCCLKQRRYLRSSLHYCCELLSKICIFVVWNNIILANANNNSVVNCFQKFVSLLSETTKLHGYIWRYKLWIAFKNLYLCCLKQLNFTGIYGGTSCELLSKICIFVVWNNT